MTDEMINLIKESHITNIEVMNRKVSIIKSQCMIENIISDRLKLRFKNMTSSRYNDILSIKDDYYFNGK